MPNWCMQDVYLHGETSMVTRPFGNSKSAIVFVMVHSRTRQLRGYRRRRAQDGKGRSSDNRRCDNWNTKWDVTNIEILHDLQSSIRSLSDTGHLISSLLFVGRHGMHLFLCGKNCMSWASKSKLEYEVEGCDVVGEFTLGEHHCRPLTDEEIKEREARWEEEDAES